MAKQIHITLSDERAEELRIGMLADANIASANLTSLQQREAALTVELGAVRASMQSAAKKARETRDAYDSAFPPPPPEEQHGNGGND